jgi:hypothetical protein
MDTFGLFAVGGACFGRGRVFVFIFVFVLATGREAAPCR